MAPLLPILPAVLAFGSTIASIAAKPDDPDKPLRVKNEFVDAELRAANLRRGRQTFAGKEQTILAGGPIGASRATGIQEQVLIGSP